MDEQNDYSEEELMDLEDGAVSGEMDSTAIMELNGAGSEPVQPGTPVYRLRLPYSHETFLAAFPGEKLLSGSLVIVPTKYGRDLAHVIGSVENKESFKAGEVIRIESTATEAEQEKSRIDTQKEQEAFRICREKISSHRLDMKLVSVHYLLDEQKILFFFTAENRVDFRELVKDLVGIFKSRIELRQIGVRDESRVVGGLGVCGRGYCCHTVSDKLKPVSIKMAKDQNLSLNSMKISGPCGRLLCCLAYEHTFYSEQRRQMPPEGCKIPHLGMTWKVIEVNPVTAKLRVVAEDGRQWSLSSINFERQDGRWRMKNLPPEMAEPPKPNR